MIIGMTPLTFIYVVLSLVAILSGAIVLLGLLGSKRLDGWTAIFLAMTVLTSATGYLFPFQKLLPSHIIGAVSLVVLAIAIVARYAKNLAGNLCDQRDGCVLPECVCADFPGFLEGAGPEGGVGGEAIPQRIPRVEPAEAAVDSARRLAYYARYLKAPGSEPSS